MLAENARTLQEQNRPTIDGEKYLVSRIVDHPGLFQAMLQKGSDWFVLVAPKEGEGLVTLFELKTLNGSYIPLNPRDVKEISP